jgi:hypothetical protein
MQTVHVTQDFPQPVEQVFAFDGKAPGIGPFVKSKLTRDVSRAMQKLAATGSA